MINYVLVAGIGLFLGFILCAGLIENSLADKKGACEADLPRSQQCEMIYVPEGDK